jgi:hypothetical protein
MQERTVRLARWSLLLLVLAFAYGCATKHKYDTAEVTGKVTFKGKPLPGGSITFVAVKGGTATSGIIEESGDYKVSAPIGEVKIQVDNRSLEKKKGPTGPILKRPDQGEPNTAKGTYVAIPEKYYTADDTPLTYTVKSGSQIHDISLD